MEFPDAFVISGLVLIVFGLLVQIVRAFQQSLGWGIANLVIPGASLVFTVCHWARARGSFFCMVIGVALVGIGAVTSEKGLSAKSFFAALTSPSDDTDVESLTASIEGQRARIEALEDQFQARGAELAKLFPMLEQRRKELGAKPEEVQRFNIEAEAYTAQNKAHQAIGAELESARNQLSGLLDERARLRAANPPVPAPQAAPAIAPAKEKGAAPAVATAGANGKRVVMYTTSRCPACVAAKTYLGRRGVHYEERDVERSSEAMKEFRSLRGRGVPLIVVGSERMEGFNPQRFERMIGG